MFRSTLLTALVAAAALTLGACGSNGDTPTPADSAAGQSSASSAVSAPASSDAAAPSVSSSAAAATADTESDSAGASAPAESGDLDAASAAWFSEACTGVTPLIETMVTVMGTALSAGVSGATSTAAMDVKATQKQLVDSLTKAQKAFGQTADKLSAMPAPNVANGPALAKQFTTTLQQAGPKLGQAAQQLAAAPITDQASLMAALQSFDSLGDELDSEGTDLLSGDLDPKVEAAVKALPACSTIAQLSSLGDTTEG